MYKFYSCYVVIDNENIINKNIYIMKHLNFLSKRQSCSHNVVTLASNVGSASAHRQGTMLKLLSVLVLILTIGVGNAWGDTAAFAPSHFTGQGTSGTGSAISAVVNGVTFACDKGYGTTQFRCYDKGTISSTNTITAITFTYSGSYNGGMQTSYTNLNTTNWSFF